MDHGTTKKVLLISARRSFDDTFRHVFAAECETQRPMPPGDDADTRNETARTLQNLHIDSAQPGPRLFDTVRSALKTNQPYYLAVLDFEGLDGHDGFELLDSLRNTAPQVTAIVACSDPAGTRQKALERLGSLDRCCMVSRTCDPHLWHQVVALQLDRCLLRDELRRTTAELEQARFDVAQARRDGKEAERFKNEFLANMSHEIRTPMNAIIGFSRLLMKEPLEPQQTEKLRFVLEAANSLSDIIANVLDFAKLTGGEFVLRNTPFDPRDVIHEILQATASRASEKESSITCHVQQAVPSRLQGDGTRFRQVLVNLVNNAVKFTEHGSIHIQSTIDEETEKTVFLRTVVTDTGAGIAADRQAIVFKEFAQADGSTTRQFGGLGLGLTICKQLVDRMDGQIGFRSSEDQGSSFWFTVPLAKTPECRSDRPPANKGRPEAKMPNCASAPAGASRLRVLVADDDQLTRTLLEVFLTRARCVVDLATNGAEALSLAETGQYDLIIMDIWMPKMDGLEAVQQIRRREASTGSRVPIIVLTAEVGDEHRRRSLEVGADEYVAKPFAPDVLFEAIGRRCHGFLDSIDPERSGDDAPPAKPELNLAGCVADLNEALATNDFAGVQRHGRDLQQRAKAHGDKDVADVAMRVLLAARNHDERRVADAIKKLDATPEYSLTH